MAYIPTLDAVQFYREAVFMTASTPTIQPGSLTKVVITPKVEVEQIPTMQASTMPAKYSFVKRKWSDVSIEGWLDYNRAMLWLDGMFGEDASSPHTYAADEDAAVTPKGLTMVFGQTGLIYQVAGLVPRELTFSCKTGEPWKFAWNGFGLAVTDGASLAALTTDVPELAHGYETSLYVDEDLDATIGTTARADVAFEFEAKITANHEPVWHQGDQAWDSVRQGKWGGSYKLKIEADATGLDTLGDIIDATDTGKGLTIRQSVTDGTNTLLLDFAGVCVDPPEIPSEFEGVRTIEFDLVPQWNSDMDSCWGATLTIA